ncbi:MAG: transporter, partial [Candidatus Omnitrophota bacterium]
PSTSQIEYGTSTTYSRITSEDRDLVIYHKVTITDLDPATLYHYRVISRDVYGNEAVSGNFTFVTLKEPPKSRPPQISDVEAAAIVAAGPQEGPVKEKLKRKTSATQPVVPLRAEQEKAGEKAEADREVISEEREEKEARGQLIKQEEPVKEALTERGGILLKKGKWQIDPSITYVYTSANRITVEGYTIFPILIVGEISTQKVKRDLAIASITTRYGLRDDLQVELSVPFRYQHDRVTVESPASETVRSASGIGDVSAGLFYQCAYEKGIMPDLIAGLSVKSNTGGNPYGKDIGLGTGHWGIKASLVAVKSSDPAILFGSLGYTYNVKRDDIEGFGTIKPGDTIDYSLGAAFALNYQLAFSAQVQQSLTRKMEMNHSTVPGSFTNVVSLKYGLTWSINKNLSCDVSASNGLTTDSPDFILEVRFPYKF